MPSLTALCVKNTTLLAEYLRRPYTGPRPILDASGKPTGRTEHYSDAPGLRAAVRELMLFSLHGLAYDFDSISRLASFLPDALLALHHAEGFSLPQLAQLFFDIKVPGKSLQTQNARCLDISFWRRVLTIYTQRLQELARYAAGRVGRHNPYSSPEQTRTRAAQLRAQKAWLESQELTASVGGELVTLPLSSVVKTAEQKIARVYAFVKAIDVLSQEAGLELALITGTLPGAWHANPDYKGKTWAWNGASPRQCSAELTRRFQEVRRDLRNKGIFLSGLSVVELHKDGTPHRHYWCAYKPEHRAQILATFATHFPGPLRLRGNSSARGRFDIAYTTPEQALTSTGISLYKNSRLKRAGFAVDVSVIDRSRSSGSSYVFKYLEKSLLTDAAQSDPALRAIDATRSLYGIRSYDFFGIEKALGRWDELRRINTRPENDALAELWQIARGGAATGRISPDQQRGDPVEFLRRLGGLSAAQSGRTATADKLRLSKQQTENQYGDKVARTVGIELLEPGTVEIVEPDTGEILQIPSLIPVAIELTRTTTWTRSKIKPAPSKVPAFAALCQVLTTLAPTRFLKSQQHLFTQGTP